MNADNLPDRDPLSELLGPPDPLRGSDPLRDIVLTQAAGILRRRRWLRRGIHAATLLTCYAAGLATMALVNRDAAPAAEPVVEQQSQPAAEPSAAPAADAPHDSEDGKDSEMLVDQNVPTKTSFKFFRAAGDYQLLRRGNLQAAARLYARALELASPEELAISVDSDNWLLISLKQSRLQDARHVHDEG